MNRRLTLAASLGALLFACGKDEPKQPATPTPAPATDQPAAAPDKTGGQAGIDEKDEKKETDTPPPASADPKTPDKPASPTTPAAAEAPVPAGAMAPDTEALTPTSVANFPPDIVAVAGTPSLKALIDAFVQQAQRVPGAEVPPDPLAMGIQMAQQKLGVDLSWLAVDKPLRFAVPNPKKYPDGVVLLLPLAGALEASAFPGATAGGGHDFSVKMDGETLYFDKLVEGYVVVTKHDDLAKNLGGFVSELAAWTPKDPLVIEASAENLVAIFGAELKEAKEMVGAMGEAMGSDPEMANKVGPMMQMAESGFALVEGASRMGLSIDPRGDFPRFAMSLRGKPGGALDQITKELAGRKIALAGAVPNDAFFVVGYDIPGLSYMSNPDAIVDSITSAPLGPLKIDWSESDKAQMKALLQKSQELQGSQGVMWMRAVEGGGFVFESLADAKDGKGIQEALLGFGELFYQKLWEQGRKAMIAQGAPESQVPAAMSFKDFLGLMSRNANAVGIGLTVNESATKSGHKVAALEMKIDWSRLPLEGEEKKLGDFFGDDLGIALAGEGQRFSSVLGPNAAKRASELLDMEIGAPTDSWLQKSQDQAFFVMMRPARLLRPLSQVVPDLAEHKAMIESLSDDPILVRGRSEGGALYIEGTLPAKLIAALATMGR